MHSVFQEYSALPLERLRFVSRFEEVNLSEARRGVVFVFAAWSGPAVAALQRFTRVMCEFTATPLDFIILDIDCLTHESCRWLFGDSGFPAGGNGETIWIRDGAIMARAIAAPEGSDETLRIYTRDLLDDPIHSRSQS